MKSTPSLQSLVGKPLNDAQIQVRTEVYLTDTDGRKTKTLDHFKDPVLAKAYSEKLPDSVNIQTEDVFVLEVDGVDFILTGAIAHKADEDKIRAEVREAALNRLSPAMQKFLGLS